MRAAARPDRAGLQDGTRGAAGMTGRAGKTRNIWLTWLVWPLLTLGIYHFVWWYKINREARDFDENIAVEPVLSLLAITVGWLIIVPPYVSIYRTGSRIGQMQEDTGMGRSCNGWIGLVLSFFFSLHSLYYQYELNRIWTQLGQPQEGSLVALPVAPGSLSATPNGTAAPPQAAPSQAARSGGTPGLSSDETSTNSGPADGDSTEG